MKKIRITMGTNYCGCPTDTIELECESEEEYDSQEFSVEILNAIFNQAFPHYFIEMDEYEEEDEDVLRKEM